MSDKLVIYRELDTLCVTSEDNYNNRIRDARQINKMRGFNNPQEVIEYYCRYFGKYGCKAEDFIIKEDEK